MLAHRSLTQLKAMRLDGVAKAFEEQLVQPGCTELSFEERIAMIIDREVSCRDTKRVDRLLKQAKLKTTGACLEDVDFRKGRGLEMKTLAALDARQRPLSELRPTLVVALMCAGLSAAPAPCPRRRS